MSRGLYPETDLIRALARKVFGPSKPQATINSPDTAGRTIAMPDTCWCLRPKNHDWPGRDEGAPHPRYPE